MVRSVSKLKHYKRGILPRLNTRSQRTRPKLLAQKINMRTLTPENSAEGTDRTSSSSGYRTSVSLSHQKDRRFLLLQAGKGFTLNQSRDGVCHPQLEKHELKMFEGNHGEIGGMAVEMELILAQNRNPTHFMFISFLDRVISWVDSFLFLNLYMLVVLDGLVHPLRVLI